MDELDAIVRPGPELARPLQRRVRNVMWERCGVVRDEAGLAQGRRELDEVRSVLADVDVRPGAEGWSDLAHALDLRGGLLAAEATMLGAQERRETRGAHNRSDFPALDPEFQTNFHVRLDGERLSIERRPVPAAPPELDELVRTAPGVEPAGDRLLE